MNQPPSSSSFSRRYFVKQSALATTTLGALLSPVGSAWAAGSDRLKVGLVGCGSRGIGAAMNCVIAAPNVEIAALGDVFPDMVKKAYQTLKTNTGQREWSCSKAWEFADRITATPETCFTGLDAYQKVIQSGVQVVLFATPPHFRPAHLKAAVEAGKHCFIEKPVAVDPVGVRSIIASSAIARQKGLAIVAGTQRRHQTTYLETMQRLHGGAIGEIVAGECYWNGPCTRTYGFYHPRQKEWTDAEYQLRNWYFYTWLSGDHIVEQHVHNLDVINWAIGANPIEALAVGGRQWRVEPEYGNIYDHFAVRYRYPNGAMVLSMARQINNCADLVWESVIGTQGTAQAGKIAGSQPWTFSGTANNPYEQEHANLIQSILDGKPLNEGKQVAESTLAAIMGRMSAYTGQAVKWDFAMNRSQLDLSPKQYRLDKAYEIAPVAIPGVEELA